MVFFPGLALLSDQTLDDQLVSARILAQKLVGGFNPSNPSEKYARQIGNRPQGSG